jgi:hypothetical protein
MRAIDVDQDPGVLVPFRVAVARDVVSFVAHDDGVSGIGKLPANHGAGQAGSDHQYALLHDSLSIPDAKRGGPLSI